jgi:hypothetical protein
MNRWGPDGCRSRRNTIADWLKRAYGEQSVIGKIKNRMAGAVSGVAWKIDWNDPFLWLVDEAIRRAESVENDGGN